jgi:hypothetical protein
VRKPICQDNVMRSPKSVWVVLALLLVPTTWAYDGQAFSPSPASNRTEQPLSMRVVAYQIDARLNVANKPVDATETLTYRNLTGRPLDTFLFHLYLNAFQPASTFMREVRLYGTQGRIPGSEWDPKHYGAIDVKSLEVVGQGDLTQQMDFIQPDDTTTFRNPDDHTVSEVRLRQPVAPGGRGNISDRLPRPPSGSARSHRLQTRFFHSCTVVSQGRRVVARRLELPPVPRQHRVLRRLGTYDVKLTVPQNYVLGSSGDEVASAGNSDGTKTVTHGQRV